jgi:hypothetical protein
VVPERRNPRGVEAHYVQTMTTLFRSSLIVALVLTACEEDDGTGDDGADASTSSSGTGDGSGSEDPTAQPGSEAGSEEEAGSGAPAMCEPEEGDDECNLCTKMECCEEVTACFADPTCECMTGCATGLNDIPMCTDMCGQSNMFSALTTCVTLGCASECI